MSEPYAKVIADSVAPDGTRLTTMEVRFHRFVLAEFNTHRVFSRSSASSRAIPLRKQIDRVYSAPAIPVVWAAEQKGMQGGGEVPQAQAQDADDEWRKAATAARAYASGLGEKGIHKSIANRLLEPFMWHTVVVTSTAWSNFFDQRCSPLAQPEIRVAAEKMRSAYERSEPFHRGEGEWHLPYIDRDHDGDYASCEDWVDIYDRLPEIEGKAFEKEPHYIERNYLSKVSAARSARVSYLTQDGQRDIAEDLRLYERLVTAKPAHWSPLEHVATPWGWNRQEGCIHFGQDETSDHDTFTCITLDHLPRVGNLLGWRSLRTEEEAKQQEVTYR